MHSMRNDGTKASSIRALHQLLYEQVSFATLVMRTWAWRRTDAKNELAYYDLFGRCAHVGLNRRPVGVAGTPMVKVKGALAGLSFR